MGDPIMIDAHDIRFSYDGPGGRRSLNGAQLHVAPGEFVADRKSTRLNSSHVT